MSTLRDTVYKDTGVSWLGQIPVHWTALPLRYLAQVQGGGTPSAEHIVDGDTGDYLWATPTDMEGWHSRISETSRSITEKGREETRLYVAASGDILFSCRAPVGKVALICSAMTFNQGCKALVVRADIQAAYLAYQLDTNRIALQLYANGTTFAEISAGAMRSVKLLRPPFDEQQAIAAFLDRETAKIDALVAEQERLLVLLEEKRQAVIANAVTKGLDPTVPMKDSGVEWLGQVPAHWFLQPVRWLSTFITSGPRGWSDYIDIEGSLFIQSGDLTEDATIEFSAAKRVKVQDDAETARTSLQEGDVVVCITGAKTGKVAVCMRLPETAYVNQHLCLIRPKQDVVPTFLGHALKSRVGREHFQSTQYGLKQGLSLDDIKTAVIPLPPRAEQKHILGHLSAQERVYRGLSEEAQQLASLLGERRAALISAAATGKINVRALTAATEPALAAE